MSWMIERTPEEQTEAQREGYDDLAFYEPRYEGWCCGHDFMAGTICSLQPNHEGPHAPICQICEGDWYDGTCECEEYDYEEDLPDDSLVV